MGETIRRGLMNGKAARAKGLNFERQLAGAFRRLGWLGAKRHLEFQQAEARGFDLDGTEPFKIQCKCLAHYAPVTTIASIQTEPGEVPVLVTKADDAPAMVVLPLADFLRIVAQVPRAIMAPPKASDFA